MNWFGQKRRQAESAWVRLSDTPEIQSLFRREVDALLKEAGADFPLVPDGTIDGKGYLEALDFYVRTRLKIWDSDPNTCGS